MLGRLKSTDTIDSAKKEKESRLARPSVVEFTAFVHSNVRLGNRLVSPCN